MGLAEDGFYSASLGKVLYLIDQWRKEQERTTAALRGQPVPSGGVETVRSFKEMGLGGLL